MTDYIELNPTSAFGAVNADNLKSLEIDLHEEKDNWKLEVANERGPEMSKVGHDQFYKWKEICKFFRSRIIKEPIDDEIAINIFRELCRDINLIRHNSLIWQDVLMRHDQTSPLPPMPPEQSPGEVDRILDQYRAALITMRALLGGPDARFIRPFTIESRVDNLRAQLDNSIFNAEGIEKKIMELASAMMDVQLSHNKLVQEKFNEAVSEIEHIKDNVGMEFSALSQDLVSKVEEYQSTFEAAKTKLALEEPVKKWVEDSARHQNAAEKALKWAYRIGLSTAGVAPLVGLAAMLAGHYALSDGESGLPRLVFAAVTTMIFLTFGIWATRIAVRYYMTEQHLKNDAVNRIAITDTFIKLNASMKITDPKLDILLASIMRPSQDGIVQDDGLPHGHPAAMLVQLIDPKKAAP